ncbi:poly(A) polymerase I [Candidatus Methylobacter favarea]|uniref:Poly(A) polymerase I n=1 Tax=Candidatus Methylobacter favarea TaxID=2707345 RepID=A0A8S0WKG6_9GAMM|nr:polynucleotide adenylyltransferase PcnB [Candidatus Methylobacter favarea]CAA9891960.1 poly(A) polymerase I [Candidatus Methylobacter favarea]
MPSAAEVKIYPRSAHTISRTQISENALKVLYRLQKSGFDAYLVGGCVRDLLLGREPKDFDVATNADPEQIRKIFRNCRLIGRRFRLAHVHFGREVIEVATFRGGGEEQNDRQMLNKEGRLLRDNVYGTIEEDVWRRDFTVNALYYNIRDFSVVDYTGGMEDHRAGMLRLIGDPETRFREDPVRMLRAVRFAVKLGFKLHPDCEKSIPELAELLSNIPSARLYDEALKLFLSGYALQTFEMLRHYGLFKVLFPATESSLAIEENGFPKLLLIKALENSDNRIAEGKTVTAYFLLAAFLWEPVQVEAKENMIQGMVEYIAYQEAAGKVISRQIKSTALPRHISMAMREVWNLQPRFAARIGSKPNRLLKHPRFRAAYDFFVLRAETGGADPELADWWRRYQDASEAEQRKMTQPSRRLQHGKSCRKKNFRKNPSSNATGNES